MRFLARVAILLVLFCAPFVLVAIANRRRDSVGLVLIVPFFLAPPLGLSALLVFAPIERYLDARGLGHLKNAGVPLLGGAEVAVLATALLVLLAAFEPGRTRRPRNALTVRQRLPRVLAMGGTLGAVGGLLWRLSDWAARWLALRGSG